MDSFYPSLNHSPSRRLAPSFGPHAFSGDDIFLGQAWKVSFSSAGLRLGNLLPPYPSRPSSPFYAASSVASLSTTSRAVQVSTNHILSGQAKIVTALRIFLVVMTNLLLLVGAGLFSKAFWAFEENAFQKIVGASIDDTGGTGPGSYDVRGNVWHLNCCSTSTGGWQIFNGILGWQNSATSKLDGFLFLITRQFDERQYQLVACWHTYFTG